MSINIDFQTKIIRFKEIKDILIPELNRIIEKSKDYIRNNREELEVFDEMEKIRNCKIKRMNLKNEEIDYFYRNHTLLESYFTNLKKIENDENTKKNIDHFFNKNKENNIDENVNFMYLKQNGRITIDDKYDPYYCVSCNTSSLVMNEENQYFCTLCFRTDNFLHTLDNLNYSNIYCTNTSYVRLNHFRRIILNWNGIATMTISKEIIQKIENQMKRSRIEKTKITYVLMKKLVKKLHLSKYNNQINYFLKTICNLQLGVINEKLSNILICMFLELQSVFNIIVISRIRHNFFGYRYTLIKFLHLLNEDKLIEDNNSTISLLCKNRKQELLFEECMTKIDIKTYLL